MTRIKGDSTEVDNGDPEGSATMSAANQRRRLRGASLSSSKTTLLAAAATFLGIEAHATPRPRFLSKRTTPWSGVHVPASGQRNDKGLI